MNETVLGLDLGEKRIGVAIAHAGTNIALPLTTIEVKGRGKSLEEIKRLVQSYKVKKIVVGLPKTLKGEIGIAAEKRVKETEWYRGQIDIPIDMWDERLSSKEAERILLDFDVSRERRKEVIDKLAAQRILQNYIDFFMSNPKGNYDL